MQCASAGHARAMAIDLTISSQVCHRMFQKAGVWYVERESLIDDPPAFERVVFAPRGSLTLPRELTVPAGKSALAYGGFGQ